MSFFDALFSQRQLQDLRKQLDQRGALINQLEGQLAELRRSMTDLSNRHRETLELIDDLENDLDAARARHEDLEDDTRAERALLERETATRERSEADLRAQIDQLLAVVKATQAATTAKDAELQAERTDRTRAEGELRAMIEAQTLGERRTRDDLERRLDELARHNGELAEALRSVSAQLAAASDETTARERDVARANEERNNALQRANELEASLRVEENAGRSSREAVAQLETALQHERTAREDLERRLRDKIENLMGGRDKIRTMVQTTSTDLERARADLRIAEAELSKERELRRQEVAAAEKSRQDTKALLREAHEALRRERDASLVLRASLDKTMEEKAQLALDLAHSPMRQKLAAMEEAAHVHLARALDLAEPLAEEDQREDAVVEREIQRALAIAAESGGTLVARGRKDTRTGAMTPEKFAAHHETHSNAWAIALDDSAPLRQAIGAVTPGLAPITLSEATLRVSADFPLDPAISRPSPSQESMPKRVIVVACEDTAVGAQAAETLARIAAGRALPSLPPPQVVRALGLDLDAWLTAALAAADNPKVAVLHVNSDALEMIAARSADDRFECVKALLLRARVLNLAWSDKCLGIARRQTFGAGADSGAFDEGDARMSVPMYRQLVRGDQRLERLSTRGGLFKPSDTVKLFVELTNGFALMQFCRDAGFAVKPARVGDMPALFEAGESPRTAEFTKLIRAAVEEAAAWSDTTRGLGALARAQERAGRYADALNTFMDAVREAPADIDSRVAAATYLELSGRDAAAERMLRDGLRQRESIARAADALRDFYRRTDNPAKTLAAARLMRRANLPAGALAVAAAAAALGDTTQARRAIDAFQETHRTRPAAMARIAHIIDLRETLPALQEATETGGAAAWFALGETLRQLDEIDEAAQAYARAESAEKGWLARMCGPGVGPDLLLVGPPRTATTLLRKVLDLHPAVALLDGESSFLTRATPLPSFVDQLRQARARKGATLSGDKSPMHFILDPARVALAAQLFPQARIVITTREPVERAWSEIKLSGHRRVIDANIAAALGGGNLPRWLADTIEGSRYAKHMKLWGEYFGADRILLLQSEDFEHNVHANCARLFDWLGLPHLNEADVDRLQRNWSNRTANYPRDPALNALLERECGDEAYAVRDLEALLASERRGRHRAP